ncbi:MAG: cyclic nucleotide-binding domain-containing protein, partial [Armatimonadetes bacterium]|nr:cyclic nucleotide-binding domain-containing protein [Armatimonadota bacterium]
MDHAAISNSVLGNLTEADLGVLLNLNFRRPFERGEVVVAAGESVNRFYLIEAGALRMEGEPGKKPRFLREGQVFGSTSLILTRPSPNSVTATDDGIVITLTCDELDWLVEAQPGVAARLLRALAAGLAARTVHEPIGAGALPAADPAVPRATGWESLAEACRDAEAELGGLGQAPEEGAARWARERIPKVAGILRPVMRAVAAVVEGSAPGAREGCVEQARMELRKLLGTSRMVDRMGKRQPGQAAGYRLFNHIYRNQPEGDDTAGLLADAWLLTRPFAEAIRERRSVATERLTREVRERARPDRVFRILSLGCGP